MVGAYDNTFYVNDGIVRLLVGLVAAVLICAVTVRVASDKDAAAIRYHMPYIRNQLIMHQQDENKPKVYLHYSPQESTYQNHIADMLTDLRRFHFEVEEDCGSLYASHNEVGQYFIPYFQKICREILNSKRFF